VKTIIQVVAIFAINTVLLVSGCARTPTDTTPSKEGSEQSRGANAGPSKEDLSLADAQGYCPISSEKLGGMGTPVKVLLKDQPVFLCCKSCEKKALADPEGTLTKVAAMKDKVKNDPSER
jgi:hypothetical protein